MEGIGGSSVITQQSTPDAEDPSAAAARWVELLTSSEASEDEIGELRQWLDADPENRRAYERARAVWASLADTGLSSASLRHQRREQWKFAGGALAASLALFLIVPGWHDYSTGTGEIRRLELPDGSIAWLDSGSAIDVAFDDERRTIRLAEGRVAIEVAGDPHRSLALEADGATITDIGTTFSADVAHGLDVAVSEGLVDVEQDDEAIRLAAGEAALFDGSSPRRRLAKTGEFAWRDGRIVLDDVSLDSALAELDRYYSGRIILSDAGLGGRRVSGTLFADRPADGAKALAKSQGLRVTRLPWLMIVGR